MYFQKIQGPRHPIDPYHFYNTGSAKRVAAIQLELEPLQASENHSNLQTLSLLKWWCLSTFIHIARLLFIITLLKSFTTVEGKSISVDSQATKINPERRSKKAIKEWFIFHKEEIRSEKAHRVRLWAWLVYQFYFVPVSCHPFVDSPFI